MHDDDDPIVQRPDETQIQPPRPVPPLGDADEVSAVHEEERTRVLPDGTVVHETDRVEQKQSRFRELLPWIADRRGRRDHPRRTDRLVHDAFGQQDRAERRRAARSTTPSIACRHDGFKTQIARAAEQRTPSASCSARIPRRTARGRQWLDRAPHGVLGRGHGRRCRTPSADTQADARDQLVNAGFAVTTAEVFSSQPVGTVVAQDPAAGTKAPPGTKVRINVSKGPGNVPVPSQVGNHGRPTPAPTSTAKGFKPRRHARAVELAVGHRRLAELRRAARRRADRPCSLNVSQGPSTDTTTTPTTPTTPTTDTTATDGHGNDDDRHVLDSAVMGMTAYICETCGTQFAESASAPAACPICLDAAAVRRPSRADVDDDGSSSPRHTGCASRRSSRG